MPHIKTELPCTIQPETYIIKDVIGIFRSNEMEENGITFADYIVNRVCPDNRFLEEECAEKLKILLCRRLTALRILPCTLAA